jgi:hypothetical protein
MTGCGVNYPKYRLIRKAAAIRKQPFFMFIIFLSNMFYISKIKGRLLFIILGIISTAWFLIRVIPKPSRATYPCMRAAAPFMSGFIMYLLSVWGAVMISRKTRFSKFNVRYIAAFMLVSGVIAVMAVAPSSTEAEIEVRTGTADGPNQPFGTAVGINPGRVVWVWDPTATNENAVNAFYLHKPENTNQEVVKRMVADGILELAGKRILRNHGMLFSVILISGKPEKTKVIHMGKEYL